MHLLSIHVVGGVLVHQQKVLLVQTLDVHNFFWLIDDDTRKERLNSGLSHLEDGELVGGIVGCRDDQTSRGTEVRDNGVHQCQIKKR